MDRISIRRKINLVGHNLYESIIDRDLQCLVGDIMAHNEEYVLNNMDTYGTEVILRQGFTDNQLKWIENLKNKLTTTTGGLLPSNEGI